MLDKLFYDSETCGLHGMPVLLQYAIGDGPIHLFEPWLAPIGETLDRIEMFMGCQNIGFNLSFDHFQLCKLYTTLRLFPRDARPYKIIDKIAAAEREAQEGPCLKPASALDLMLHSRKTEFQSLMARDDVRIRRVPTALAYPLAEELEKRIEIDGIYFARRADRSGPRWHVYDVPNTERTGINPDFKDVVLKFHPAGGLKFLAEHALGVTDTVHFSEIEVPRMYRPVEVGFAPFAEAVSSAAQGWKVFDKDGKLKGKAWPGRIMKHIRHWHRHAKAREYARKDVVYTRGLYKYFGCPEGGDDDSTLACSVAAVRWKGYHIDIEGIKALQLVSMEKAKSAPQDYGAVRRYLKEAMDDVEALAIRESTKKTVLEDIAKTWKTDDGLAMHPAAVRSQAVLDARTAQKEVELYDKLITAGKFHASFNIIGALSSRMSGADGLNAQGIKNDRIIRSKFPLHGELDVLCGGDMSSYEVCIAIAAFGDDNLLADVLAGKKIHAYMGMELFPGTTYEEIVASSGTPNDMYTAGKQAVFAIIYGGDAGTINRKIGIPLEIAERAFEGFQNRYPGIRRARIEIFEKFASMRQPGGIGSAIEWHEPEDKIESLLGFARYFTLENKICKALYSMANTLPPEMRRCNIRVVRRDRVQTAGGAVSSALYGAAFSIQSGMCRAAANHRIQSTGAQITKAIQRRIWDVQPAGVSSWLVAPANVHDEILSVTAPSAVDEVAEVVRQGIEDHKVYVPLLAMTWDKCLTSWAGTH
jgi:hypothetical protein